MPDGTKLSQVIELLEAANAELEPEVIDSATARGLMRRYARAQALASYGVTALARKVNDAGAVAKATGTSLGRAKATVATAEALASAAVTRDAFSSGRVSADQAAEIARAEVAVPGSARELLQTATSESFQVLRDSSRRLVLEAEQHRDLGERQQAARSARVSNDELGMVDIHLKLQPHVGTPIVARAEAEAKRRHNAAKGSGASEAFTAHLADAYAAMLAGSSLKPRSKRPELVVLVSHEVASRGWTDVRPGEVCKIPGVGPVPPQVAKGIATEAFLNVVISEGKDLRHFKRWSRAIPVEVQVALELGSPPEFDGVKCVDCGQRFHTEFDHQEPVAARGPTSHENLPPRCWPCHVAKTARDRAAGKLRAGAL